MIGPLSVESVFSQTTIARLALPEDKSTVPVGTLVLPDLLRCLVLTWSEGRAELLRSAANNESWQPTVNIDIREFLRNVFLLRVPLTFVDLPDVKIQSYAALRDAAQRAKDLSDSLIVICGVGGGTTDHRVAEELWARQLGAWAYLPGDNGLPGLELIFGDARKAVANKALVCVELDAYR
jgi:hypothetical protein